MLCAFALQAMEKWRSLPGACADVARLEVKMCAARCLRSHSELSALEARLGVEQCREHSLAVFRSMVELSLFKPKFRPPEGEPLGHDSSAWERMQPVVHAWSRIIAHCRRQLEKGEDVVASVRHVSTMLRGLALHGQNMSGEAYQMLEVRLRMHR